jgi:4-hydroxybenzoate polyprenyltransferase
MAAATVLFAGSAYLAGAGWLVYAGIAAGAAHFAWQIRMLEPSDPARCLMLFRANRDYGWILFAGIVASGLAPGPL